MGCVNAKALEPAKHNSVSFINVDTLMDKRIPNYFIEEPLSGNFDKKIDNEENNLNENDDNLINKERLKRKVGKIRATDAVNNTIHEQFTIKNKVKTERDLKFLIDSLKSNFFFVNFSDSELEYMIHKMFYCQVAENEFIFKQGDNASSFFVLEKGAAEVIIEGEIKKTLKSGSGFGDLALLYNAPRSASIKTNELSYFWGIDRLTFRKAVEEMSSKSYIENRQFIDTVTFFKWMTNEQKNSIASVILTHKYSVGEYIVHEGDDAASFYIIKEGTVSISKGGKEIRHMSKGDSFGEQALFINMKRGASVKALDQVKCLALGRDTLTNILGDKVQKITYRNIQKWAFDKSTCLQQLTNIQKEKVIDSMIISNVKANTVLFPRGSKCHKLIIIIEGSLKKGTLSQFIVKGSIFGDQHLLIKNQDSLFDDDIIMESDGVLAQIEFSVFFNCIGGSIEEVIPKNEFSHERNMFKEKEKEDLSHFTLNNLICIKKLGFGQFGSVFLVKNPNEQNLYALKCISKAQIVEQNLEKHLIQEKQVMQKVTFIFTMNFLRSFKDDNYIYFLLEFVKGMELFDVIRDMGLLTVSDSQFYIGSLILTLEYLNSHKIIYRDIKPENLMVDHQGYLKMIDMGTAKILNNSNGPARTFTIIGTPHYMAPEIISGKGYSFPVDLWSIGIMLFEFVCGYLPFGEEAEDPFEIYQIILKTSVIFPGFFKDKNSKKIIIQLLNKIPDARLGGGSFAALKANSWFDKFDWDSLYSKNLKPPFLPPKEKLIKDQEIKNSDFEKKSILVELKELAKTQNHKKNLVSKVSDWDKNF